MKTIGEQKKYRRASASPCRCSPCPLRPGADADIEARTREADNELRAGNIMHMWQYQWPAVCQAPASALAAEGDVLTVGRSCEARRR